MEQKFIVYSKDIDYGYIYFEGYCSTAKEAIEYIKTVIKKELCGDKDGCIDWLYENDEDCGDKPTKDQQDRFVKDQLIELNDRMENNEWRREPNIVEFEWGCLEWIVTTVKPLPLSVETRSDYNLETLGMIENIRKNKRDLVPVSDNDFDNLLKIWEKQSLEVLYHVCSCIIRLKHLAVSPWDGIYCSEDGVTIEWIPKVVLHIFYENPSFAVQTFALNPLVAEHHDIDKAISELQKNLSS